MEQRLEDQGMFVKLEVVQNAWEVKSKVGGKDGIIGWVQKLKKQAPNSLTSRFLSLENLMG